MPLTAWQNQLRAPREHQQLCRWGKKKPSVTTDKTQGGKKINKKKKLMNSKMERTMSENTLPSGQAVCSQM